MPSSITASIALAMCGVSTKPNSPTKYAFLPFVSACASRIGLDEIVIVAPGIVVRRDDVDVRVVERLHRHAVQRLAVDHQVVRIELLDVRGDFARPLGRRDRFRCPSPSRKSPARRDRRRRCSVFLRVMRCRTVALKSSMIWRSVQNASAGLPRKAAYSPMPPHHLC